LRAIIISKTTFFIVTKSDNNKIRKKVESDLMKIDFISNSYEKHSFYHFIIV